MQNKITVKGARVNNLKNIDIEIPRNKLGEFGKNLGGVLYASQYLNKEEIDSNIKEGVSLYFIGEVKKSLEEIAKLGFEIEAIPGIS